MSGKREKSAAHKFTSVVPDAMKSIIASYGLELSIVGGSAEPAEAVQAILLEALIGIEPANKGFADLCLTWLSRRVGSYLQDNAR